MRRLLCVAAAAVLATLFPLSAAAAPQIEPTTTTPIKHLVMLMQDNHSFDNYFGTYPGADGIPAGTCLPVRTTSPTDKCVEPFHLGSAPVEDLSHGVGVQKRQYNDGKMDGFVAAYRRLGLDGSSAVGYYDGDDLPYYWNVADEYVLFDRFFSSTAVGARESYLYWTAGTAPASDKPLTSSAGYNSLPTIFDRLAAKNVSAKFYVENFDERSTGPRSSQFGRPSQSIKVPLLSMSRFRDGGDLEGRIVDLDQYYADLRGGTLPAVSYIVTSGSSENPPASLRAGQDLVRKLTGELARSSAWDSSAFMWTYDGWGGWYDHVPPPKVDARGYGFRVPALLVSPYAKRGVVDSTVLDYTAMLKFIETNWQVPPLARRDAASPGLSSAFDFSTGPRQAQILGATRDVGARAAPVSSPTPVIYSTYGLALVFAAVLTAAAAIIGSPLGGRVATSPLALWAAPRWQAATGLASAGRTMVSRRAHESLRPTEAARLPDGTTWQEWYQSGHPPPTWGASTDASPAASGTTVLARPLRPTDGTLLTDGTTWQEWYRSRHPQTPAADADPSPDRLTAQRHPRSPRRAPVAALGSGSSAHARGQWLRDHLGAVEPDRLADGSTWQEWYQREHEGATDQRPGSAAQNVGWDEPTVEVSKPRPRFPAGRRRMT